MAQGVTYIGISNYSNERKGNAVTEIVFTNKESIESEETPSQIDTKIGRQHTNESQPS